MPILRIFLLTARSVRRTAFGGSSLIDEDYADSSYISFNGSFFVNSSVSRSDCYVVLGGSSLIDEGYADSSPIPMGVMTILCIFYFLVVFH